MLDQAIKLQDKLVAYRHDFHKNPEVGFNEYRTSAKVSEILTSLGCRARPELWLNWERVNR
jgi:metal-dependent amidase/aminoacylase/carboxypeptidase family protein